MTEVFYIPPVSDTETPSIYPTSTPTVPVLSFIWCMSRVHTEPTCVMPGQASCYSTNMVTRTQDAACVRTLMPTTVVAKCGIYATGR